MILAGIATMRERHKSLIDTLESLAPQVDMIGVCLNDYTPGDFEMLRVDLSEQVMKCTMFYIPGEDLTDAGKFAFWDRMRWEFYLSCDDDLIYPPDYVKSIVERCNFYDCPVSYHGYNLKEGKPFIQARAHKIHCLHSHPADEWRDVIGTGVACFPFGCFTDKEGDNQLAYLGFEPKMADLNVMKLAKRMEVPLMALQHEGGWITHSDKVDRKRTIWAETAKDDSKQTEFING